MTNESHPAPVAPQAEPCIGNDSACPCQDGDACHYKDAADGTKAWPVPQAEPKRLRECAQRLVDGARWNLAGALSPSSKAREIPSSAWSDVKSRHLASLRDALAAPQAEPKREPLSDERIDEIGDPFGYFQYGDAQGDKRRAFARAVERAAYERAAALVIELREDHVVADAIRALGRQ